MRFKGVYTIVYGVKDLQKAKEWYTRIVGLSPYFDQPFYVGFNVAGYELGLNPDADPVHAQNAGVVAYWGVDNIKQTLQKLIAECAVLHEDIQDVGENIKVASVLDQFGNVFGIIQNPHFKENT